MLIENASVARFVAVPEHGMGYHIARAGLDRDIVSGVVYGSEIFAPTTWLKKCDALSTARWLLEIGADHELRRSKEPLVATPVEDEAERASVQRELAAGDVSDLDREFLIDRSADAPIAWIAAGVYGRFAVFRHDSRLTPDGHVLPGTFVTTWDDAIRTMKFENGQDITDRYALPGSMPRTHLFRIEISSPVLGRQGVAPRRFGRGGGGIEILLPFGVAYPAVQGFYTTEDGKNWSEHAYP